MNDIQAELEQFSRDTAYYEAHQEELLQQYPEQWLAIYNQQVGEPHPLLTSFLIPFKPRVFQ